MKRETFPLLNILYNSITRIGIILAASVAGAIGIFLNYLYMLHVAIGSLVILAFLRNRYLLLIVCILLNALIGSSLPLVNGNNLLSSLVIPTFLLMFTLPLKKTIQRMPALGFLAIYLVWVFASISISEIGTGAFLINWFGYIYFLAISILTINVTTTWKRLIGLVDAILLLSTFVSIYGIYGYITKQSGITDTTTSLFRITSIFGAAPTLALFLSLGIPLALYRALTLQGLIKRVGISILVLIYCIALALTATRTTEISLPLSIMIIIFFLPSHKIKIGLLSSFLVLTLLTILFTTISGIPILSRFFNPDILTLNNRVYLWHAVLDHFDPTRLLGSGLKSAQILLTNSVQVSVTNQGIIATSPHSAFLEILYDHGIIGVALLALALITLAANLITGIRGTTGNHRLLFVTAFAIFVSVLIQSFESEDIWLQGIGMYFWLIMSLPFAYCWSQAKQPSKYGKNIFAKTLKPQMKVEQETEHENVSPVPLLSQGTMEAGKE